MPPERRPVTNPVLNPTPSVPHHRERRRMLAALGLLLVALGLVIVKDRDFWFPPSENPADLTAAPLSESPVQPESHTAAAAPSQRTSTSRSSRARKRSHAARGPARQSLPPVVITRTALPPLQVEVVAGDRHSDVLPQNNALQLDMQSAGAELAAARTAETPAVSGGAAPADSADRVSLSFATREALSHSVKPGYPLLARQTKVQGAVLLEALISREGAIQDLRVLSGPPILATAAREAVKKWRFKPYYEGNRPVETAARITVNFTISTN